MSGLSNVIESFIIDLINRTDTGVLEIARNQMAERFQCAPSQINYVLTTRFTAYKGYYIESRQGGGGYIRITKVNIDSYEDINHIILNTIGDSITQNKSYHIIESLVEADIISVRESKIMKSAISDSSLSCESSYKNILRADILKNILLILVK